MRQGSLWSGLLALLNLAVVAVAVYVAVDALDLSRRQNVRTERALNRLATSIDRLSDTLDDLEYAASSRTEPGDDDVATASRSGRTSGRSSARGAFANDEFRDPDAEHGGSLVTSTISFIGSLNSVVNNEATLSSIYNLCVGSLAQLNNNDLTKFEPVLAESWEVDEAGLVYTIHLRKNAFWQPYVDPVTGDEVPAKPVTSRDFLFYWNTIQNESIPCDPIRNYYELLDRIEAVDDYTFKVIWREAYSLGESFTLGLSPLPEHYYRPDPTWDDARFADEFISSPRNQWIVGTGPYKLVSWDKNTGVTLEVDDNHFGPKPYIRTRRIRVIPDPNISFLEFKRDQIDSYGLLPTQWHEETPEPLFQLVTPEIKTAREDSLAWDAKKKAGELPENYQFEKFQYEGSSWAYIGYNQNRPMFADRKVRSALTHLVDRQRILDEVFLGLGEIISGPFIPRSPYYNHDIKPLPFDIERAKELLAEAGWEDTDGDGILDRDYDGSGERKPFTFTFIIPSSSSSIRKWAAIIEQDMLKANIKPVIKPIDWSVYVQSLDEKNFDVCSLLWSGGVEGDPYQIWHGSGARREGSSNHVGYDSPEANRLIEEGRRTVDKRKRYAIYHELHRVIAEDQPYTFLVAPTVTLAQHKRFRNAVVYRAGMDMSLEWIPEQMQLIR
ncbi:MAG: ABC transporter substrate-binding protein [Planctomycetota bacterium]|jgi:ABC-type transport system substrate-binding protein|nr:ABC transporter substrate-binding protein [Planctomycetota bacterium]